VQVRLNIEVREILDNTKTRDNTTRPDGGGEHTSTVNVPTRQDKTRDTGDEAEKKKARQGKARQGKARQETQETRQRRGKQSKARLGKARLG
jgi:hypothetical protein